MQWYRSIWRNKVLIGIMLPRPEGIAIYTTSDLKDSEEFLKQYNINVIKDKYNNIIGIEGESPESPNAYTEKNAPEIVMTI